MAHHGFIIREKAGLGPGSGFPPSPWSPFPAPPCPWASWKGGDSTPLRPAQQGRWQEAWTPSWRNALPGNYRWEHRLLVLGQRGTSPVVQYQTCIFPPLFIQLPFLIQRPASLYQLSRLSGGGFSGFLGRGQNRWGRMGVGSHWMPSLCFLLSCSPCPLSPLSPSLDGRKAVTSCSYSGKFCVPSLPPPVPRIFYNLLCSHDTGVFLLGGQELSSQEPRMWLELQRVKETTALPDDRASGHRADLSLHSHFLHSHPSQTQESRHSVLGPVRSGTLPHLTQPKCLWAQQASWKGWQPSWVVPSPCQLYLQSTLFPCRDETLLRLFSDVSLFSSHLSFILSLVYILLFSPNMWEES